MMRTFALLLLAGCGLPDAPHLPRLDLAPKCVTRCGLRLEGPTPEITDGPQWTCDELQRTEDQILSAFASVEDPRFAQTCGRISGWSITVAPGVFLSESVGGVTKCQSGELVVDGLAPLNSSLAHELAHVVQDCRPRGPGDHGAWDEDGITGALEQVSTAAYAQYRRCAGGQPDCR